MLHTCMRSTVPSQSPDWSSAFFFRYYANFFISSLLFAHTSVDISDRLDVAQHRLDNVSRECLTFYVIFSFYTYFADVGTKERIFHATV